MSNPPLHALVDVLLTGLDRSRISMSISQPVDYVYDEDAKITNKEVLEADISYNWLQWESDVYPKPSEDEFLLAVERAHWLAYREERRAAYPPIDQQLDTLYHEGYDGWRATIEAVKQQFPKPEV